MNVQEIPLTPEPQTFSVTLANVEYKCTVQWRAVDMGGWVLDLADTDGNPILCGVPLVTGVDLLAQYAYLDFGGQLRVQTDNDPDVVPTFENLGVTSHLYFVTE